jgi:hypothetical protein
MALKIAGRKEWGAKAPKAITKRAPSELSGVAVHWFGSPRAAKTHEGCAKLLQGVQRDHMAPGGLGAPKGGNDIAYNHGVCPHGVAFELRGFGVQTGANGDAKSNREYAAIVFMGGGDPKKGNVDRPSNEVLGIVAELIRMWQAKGAGPLVKPHRFFTGSDCPGPDLLRWVAQEPHPWLAPGAVTTGPVEDETPPWLLDFISWRLAEDADPKTRPKSLPTPIPESAWEAAARMHRMAVLMGPQDAYLDWAQWRRQGAKPAARPRSVPRKVPKPWFQSLNRLQKIL